MKNIIEHISIHEYSTIREAMKAISLGAVGAALSIEKESKCFNRIITDGDIRRMLSSTTEITEFQAIDIMGKNPKTISNDAMAIDALNTMENNSITQMLVVDNKNSYVGVVHLHDLIKEGIF